MSALMARHMEAPLSEEEGGAIRRLVAETYNWEGIAENTISVYHTVVAQSIPLRSCQQFSSALIKLPMALFLKASPTRGLKSWYNSKIRGRAEDSPL